MAELGVKIGVRMCKECEYYLRCDECIAKPALKAFQEGHSCLNCSKKDYCEHSAGSGESPRLNCFLWSAVK